MCLVVIARPLVNGRRRFIIAANRDEYHARPAQPLHWWPDAPGIAAGRDSVAGGTWLAVRRDGRFAAVLNAPHHPGPPDAPSRGSLPYRYLVEPGFDVAAMQAEAPRFAGFHCLAGGPGQIFHVASDREEALRLDGEMVACGNRGIERPGPRVHRAGAAVSRHLGEPDPVEGLFTALADTADPGGGAGDNRPVFIRGEAFGTRCSSLVIADGRGRIGFHERRFDEVARFAGERTLAWHAEPRP